MPRQLHKLTARKVDSALKAGAPGRFGDGGGLALIIDDEGRSRWVLRYTLNGKQHNMGLGGAGSISLGDVRAKAAEARTLVSKGTSPINGRGNSLQPGITFGAFAEDLVGSIEKGFRNPKHRQQWHNTLSTYCAPIADKPIADVDTDDVLKCLQPIWSTKQETASRLRGRIERVLDAAKAKGLRDGENPARWKGHLDALLSKREKLVRGHHPALPFEHIQAFMEALRTKNSVSAWALEYLILTATRSGEVRGAVWGEIDLDAKVWTIPAVRMKAKKAHRVPLSTGALAVIERVQLLRRSGLPTELVFPASIRGAVATKLSDMALSMLVRKMPAANYVEPGGQTKQATVHGFRSTFRDWAGECTPFPREIAEAALAHAVGGAVELAYRRGDALEKRRELMQAWCVFVETAHPSGMR